MKLTPQMLVSAYSQGYFPMADDRFSDTILWHSPDPRAIFPLNNIHIPRTVRQLFNKQKYTFKINTAFLNVLMNCADRDLTWINDKIIYAYTELHHLGFAHSVEAWNGNKLAGGLYGVHVGGAFFGESMFGTESGVAKLCFYYLCYVLLKNNFLLLDSQYGNDFTYSLGAIDVPKEDYDKLLEPALNMECKFKI